MALETTAPFERIDPVRPDSPPQAVTVLGLGAMGSTLASTFVRAGHPTTVWNRTPTRAEPLVAAGADHATSIDEAVEAGGLVVVCLLDHDAVQATLRPLARSLAGRAVVNLTSTTPEDARATAAWMADAGADYLDGAIMVPTPLIGDDDALLLYSGARQVLDAHQPTLRALGGQARFLGDDPGRAALFDLALLDLYFAGLTGFVHATALVAADGVPAADLLPLASSMVEVLGASLADVAGNIDAGDHPGDDDNLDMEQLALAHVVEASGARGVDPALPDLVRSTMARAIDAGHGRESFSRIVDQLRPAG